MLRGSLLFCSRKSSTRPGRKCKRSISSEAIVRQPDLEVSRMVNLFSCRMTCGIFSRRIIKITTIMPAQQKRNKPAKRAACGRWSWMADMA